MSEVTHLTLVHTLPRGPTHKLPFGAAVGLGRGGHGGGRRRGGAGAHWWQVP